MRAPIWRIRKVLALWLEYEIRRLLNSHTVLVKVLIRMVQFFGSQGAINYISCKSSCLHYNWRMLLFWFQEMDFYIMTKSRKSGLKGYIESTMEEASTPHLTLLSCPKSKSFLVREESGSLLPWLLLDQKHFLLCSYHGLNICRNISGYCIHAFTFEAENFSSFLSKAQKILFPRRYLFCEEKSFSG